MKKKKKISEISFLTLNFELENMRSDSSRSYELNMDSLFVVEEHEMEIA